MKRWMVLMAMALLALSAWALPTVEAVQAEVKAGRYAQAESMMREVVADRPDSAKARYVHAAILAHEGRFAEARAEAQKAQSLDPAIGFTEPERFRRFEQLLREANAKAGTTVSPARPLTDGQAALSSGPTAARAVQAERVSTGIPGWVWVGGAAVLMAVVWAALSRRQRSVPAYGPASAMPGQGWAPGGVPNGPVYPPAGGNGPGWLGVGAAAAGGVAAGMLAERLLDGHREVGHGAAVGPAADAGPMPGLQPGMFDDERSNAQQALEDRSIDFGNGDDWGGGSDPGGSFDSGSSSDDW